MDEQNNEESMATRVSSPSTSGDQSQDCLQVDSESYQDSTNECSKCLQEDLFERSVVKVPTSFNDGESVSQVLLFPSSETQSSDEIPQSDEQNDGSDSNTYSVNTLDSYALEKQARETNAIAATKHLSHSLVALIQQRTNEGPIAPLPSGASDAVQSIAEENKDEKDSSSSDNDTHLPTSILDTSRVSKATAQDTMTIAEDTTQPLTFEWTFGFNRHVPCLNMTDDDRSVVLLAASHVAVLYDYKNNCQKILQGHGNPITCVDCSEDKRWLVSCDKGPSSCIIVWDTYSGIPVQAYFDVEGGGVTAVAMSFDAKYVVTVDDSQPQTVCVWDWTTPSESPIHQVQMEHMFQPQTCIRFHPLNSQLFLSNSEDDVIFYSWVTGKLEFDVPFISDSTFSHRVGLFTQSFFQTDLPQRALTTTLRGNIIVWDADRPKKGDGGVVPIHKKRAHKLVRIKERGIACLTQTDSFIVTGDTSGRINFFDSDLNLMYSYTKLNIGPINGISFKYQPNFEAVDPEGKNYPRDATIHAASFPVRDFIISTRRSEIFHMLTDGSRMTRLFKEHDGAIHAIATSPTKPWLCIGSFAGLLKLWDYETKRILVTRVMENRAKIRTLAFNHNGLQLAVGMVSGVLHVMDAISLCDEVTFHRSRSAIIHLAYSHDSKLLAAADDYNITTLFTYYKNVEWRYLARYKAHYEPIQDMCFGMDLDTLLPRLVTLGKDRILVEYDLQTSAKHNLKLLSVDRIEQSAIPLSFAWYPPVAKETFLLTANDQYKLKLYNTTTKMCRKTLLGPTYGSPVRLLTVVPAPAHLDPCLNRTLCYATDTKVGVQLLPLDGNPHRSVCSIAHPNGISRLVCSSDAKYVFTAGGTEADVHMFSINRNALEAVASLGGEGLTPFFGLLDGGFDGEMYRELEDYFYYAQLRSQGIHTMEEREVSRVVSLDQVPFLMRALGFYPSEQEVDNLINEVKFGQYVETGQYVTELDLADFIKLYINHRPAFGLSPNELYDAFDVLGYRSSYRRPPEIDRDDLLSLLQRKGEHMTEVELAEYLTTLLGYCTEGGAIEEEEPLDHDRASRNLEVALPQDISATMFASEILGLNLCG